MLTVYLILSQTEGDLEGVLEGIVELKLSPNLLLLNLAQKKPHFTKAQLSPNQALFYNCSTQPKPSPTLLMLNSVQPKLHFNIAQLSPDQAPLY